MLGVLLTGDLRAALCVTDTVGMTFCAPPNGRANICRVSANMVLEIRKKIGVEAYDLHALHHTAAPELAAIVCSDQPIKAVTSHSSKVISAHYASVTRQRARAKKAADRRCV